MAVISLLPPLRHLRSDPIAHVLQYRGGKLVRSGRGLSFWFLPLSASIAEIPCDDRDEPFLFHGRARDFQDVTTQGSITFRVTAPEKMAERIDFTINPRTGVYSKTPLEQLAELLSQSAQQLAWDYLAGAPLRDLLAEGVDEIRRRIRDGLTSDESLRSMGLEIVSVRVSNVAPTADLEKALQAPTREAIQQESDEAVFQRRALAVEKERAIAENELQNRIELARRQKELISQQGENRRHEETEMAEAERIRTEALAVRRQLRASASAASIRLIEEAKADGEGQRMDVYRSVPSSVMFGLAAQELAGTLTHIDHLNLAGDSLGPLLTNLMQAGVRHLDGNGETESNGGVATLAPPRDDDLPEVDEQPPEGWDASGEEDDEDWDEEAGDE